MNSQPSSPSVRHNRVDQRFELQVGNQLAFLSYLPSSNRLILNHTFVPAALRGGGVAAMLAHAALEGARRQGWKVVPRCSYVATFIHRHPEYADVIAEAEGAGDQTNKPNLPER